MKDKTIYLLHANICKALANPLRIEIIELIGEREVSFNDLQTETGALKSNLSQHLSLMVSSGLLVQRRDGLKAHYRLSSEKIAIACRMMRDILVHNLNKQHEMIKHL